MTRIALVLGALMLAVAARADDFGRRRPDVDVFVPIPPEGHERLYWSDGRPHHLVPGTVSINGKPYVCDLDGRRFKDGDALVVHVVSSHRIPAAEIREGIVVRDGVVHFVAP